MVRPASLSDDRLGQLWAQLEELVALVVEEGRTMSRDRAFELANNFYTLSVRSPGSPVLRLP